MVNKSSQATQSQANKSYLWVWGIIVGVLLVAAIVFLIVFIFTRGSVNLTGNIVEEPRPVANFSEVTLSGPGTLLISQGSQESLSIKADQALLEKIKTSVSGGTLDIDYRVFGFTFFSDSDIVYTLTVKDLDALRTSGSITVRGEQLSTDTLALTASGSSDVVMQLDVEQLDVRISGSGSFSLAGRADEQEVRVSGSGRYDGRNLTGQNGEVRVSGSGDIEINVSETLSVDISGSGEVGYLGSPQLTETNISGSGEINQIN